MEVSTLEVLEGSGEDGQLVAPLRGVLSVDEGEDPRTPMMPAQRGQPGQQRRRQRPHRLDTVTAVPPQRLQLPFVEFVRSLAGTQPPLSVTQPDGV